MRCAGLLIAVQLEKISPHNASNPVWMLVHEGRTGLINQAWLVAGLMEIPKQAVACYEVPRAVPMGVDGQFGLIPSAWKQAYQQAPPRMIISAGPRSARLCVKLCQHWRKNGLPIPFRVHLEKPKQDLSNFDVVIAPYHDRQESDRTIQYLAGLSRITQEVLAEHRSEAEEWVHPDGVTAALIGGDSRSFRMPEVVTEQFCQQLLDNHKKIGGTLLVTTSRRTSPASASLAQRMLSPYCADFYSPDSTRPNPYLSYLAVATSVITTCESGAMIADACSSGASPYLIRLPKKLRSIKKWDGLFDSLISNNHVRWMKDSLEPYDHQVLDQNRRIKEELRKFQVAAGLEDIGRLIVH